MPQSEIESLNKKLPEPENSWIDAIPEVLGEKWINEGLRKGHKIGLEEGREEGRVQGREEGHAEAMKLLVIKIILKFPDWSDAEVAKFIETDEDRVKAIRKEIEQKD